MNDLEKLALIAIRRGEAHSRAELARRLNISRPTASAVAERLISAGRIREAGRGISSGGKAPTMLTVVPECFYILGFDLGYTDRLQGVLTDAAGTVIRSEETAFRSVSPSDALRAVGRLARLLERQLFVDLPPEKVFPREAFALTGPLDTVFFVASVDAPGTRVRPLEPDEVAERMVFSLQYERLPFMEYYYMFRFAFPERKNAFLENAEAVQRERLRSVLENKPCYLVEHPYPAVIDDLYNVMRPLVTAAQQPAAEAL